MHASGALQSLHSWQCEFLASCAVMLHTANQALASLKRQRTRDTDSVDLYVNGTMREFMKVVERLDDCVNMLDLPTSKVEIPWMVE